MMLFMEMSETKPVDDVADVPLTVLVPAFITSTQNRFHHRILDLHSIHHH